MKIFALKDLPRIQVKCNTMSNSYAIEGLENGFYVASWLCYDIEYHSYFEIIDNGITNDDVSYTVLEYCRIVDTNINNELLDDGRLTEYMLSEGVHNVSSFDSKEDLIDDIVIMSL